MRKFVRLSILLAPLVLAGCADPLNRGGSVSGKVTIDGEPVSAGNVLFASEDGQWTVFAPLRGDGTYLVKEPPLGNVKIAVQTEMFKGRAIAPDTKNAPRADPKQVGSGGMVLPDPSVRGLIYKAIPEKYESLETSGLTCVVKRGDQEHDIPLTAK